jgi:excisionase family DNA binding protein
MKTAQTACGSGLPESLRVRPSCPTRPEDKSSVDKRPWIHSPAPQRKGTENHSLADTRDLTVTNTTGGAKRQRRLLRTKEAAEYLSVSPWKLRKLVQDGQLPIVQDSDGAAWRVDIRDLDAFIERNKRVRPL